MKNLLTALIFLIIFGIALFLLVTFKNWFVAIIAVLIAAHCLSMALIHWGAFVDESL